MNATMNRQNIIHLDGDLKTKHLLMFWGNLALMWLIMALEMPIVNAQVARLPDPTLNLAAFGVAFSLALIIEGPIIQFLSLGAARSRCKKNYQKLMKFAHVLNFGLMGVHGLIAIPAIYFPLVEGVMNIPSDIAEASWRPFLFLLFWTPAIGYRRLWQGVLIAYNKSSYLPFTMGMRLLATVIALFGLGSTGYFTGAEVAALALPISVIVGMITAGIVVKKTVVVPVNDTIPPVTWKELFLFYTPLSISSFITMANRPVVAWGIALFPKTLESLAVWPVVLSFAFIFQSLTSALQELVIVLVKSGKSKQIVQRFSLQISILVTVACVVIAATPIAEWYMAEVQDLPAELLPLTTLPLILMGITPFLAGVISWLRGYNILLGETRIVAIEGGIFLAALFIGFWALTPITSMNGVVAASWVTIIAMGAEIICLQFFGTKKGVPNL